MILLMRTSKTGVFLQGSLAMSYQQRKALTYLRASRGHSDSDAAKEGQTSV
jgi:hypothetical protein